MKHNSFIALALLLIFSSCSLQKRLYSNGYNVEWKTSKQKTTPASLLQASRLEKQIPHEKALAEASEEEETITASTDNSIIETEKKEQMIKPFYEKVEKEECDSMKFKNGKVVRAKIVSSGLDMIAYKDCDSTNAKITYINKKEVEDIKYGKEIWESKQPNSIYYSDTKARKSINGHSSIFNRQKSYPDARFEPIGLIGLIVVILLSVFAILASSPLMFILTIPISLICGFNSLRKITNNREKYKGIWIAIGHIYGFTQNLLFLFINGFS